VVGHSGPGVATPLVYIAIKWFLRLLITWCSLQLYIFLVMQIIHRTQTA